MFLNRTHNSTIMNLMPVTYFLLIYSFTLVIDEIWNNFKKPSIWFCEEKLSIQLCGMSSALTKWPKYKSLIELLVLIITAMFFSFLSIET